MHKEELMESKVILGDNYLAKLTSMDNVAWAYGVKRDGEIRYVNELVEGKEKKPVTPVCEGPMTSITYVTTSTASIGTQTTQAMEQYEVLLVE